MSYISKANLALSLTLTIVATLLSPILTPIFMQLLANRFVPIDFTAMMWSITKIVILPIIAGLLFNRYFKGRFSWLDKAMPMVSMVGIAVVITIITAAGRDAILSIGPLLVLAVLFHNSVGYVLGFGLSRLAGMDVQSARTIAFEVGMQNSGLASGIALEMGRVATMGLAPAVFGPLMNITGSSLAAFWRDRQPIKSGKKKMRTSFHLPRTPAVCEEAPAATLALIVVPPSLWLRRAELPSSLLPCLARVCLPSARSG